MLLSLLGYVLLGLLLALPIRYLVRYLVRWLGPRSGLYPVAWRYLRPYVPLAQRSPPQAPAAPPSATDRDPQRERS